MSSPWVQRNLDLAQYAQPRGSLYEGPQMTMDMPFDAADERPLPEIRAAEHKENMDAIAFAEHRAYGECYQFDGDTCGVCDEWYASH